MKACDADCGSVEFILRKASLFDGSSSSSYSEEEPVPCFYDINLLSSLPNFNDRGIEHSASSLWGERGSLYQELYAYIVQVYGSHSHKSRTL